MADSSEIRQLLLQISANTELLRSNLSEAEKAVAKFHSDTQSHLDQTDKRFAMLGKSIEGLHAPLEKLKSLGEVAITALLGESLLSKGKEALEFAGNIQFMANQVGVSTDFLQKFNYAAGQYGVQTDVADTALTRFTRTIGEAANGNKEAISLFDRLGVKIRDQNGSVRSAAAIYGDFADAVKKVDNPAQRVTDTMQAMGRQAASLTPLVAEGSAGFNTLASAAEQLGVVLSPELIEHSEEVNHKLAAMKQIIDAQMASAIASNAENISHLADMILKAAGAVATFLSKHPAEAMGLLGAATGARIGSAGGPAGTAAGAVIGYGAGIVLGPPDPGPTRQELQAQLAAKQRDLRGLQSHKSSGFWDAFFAADRNVNIQSDKDDIASLQRQLARLPKAEAHAKGNYGSGDAGTTNDNGDDLKKAQASLTELMKAKVGASGAALAAINDEIASQKRYVALLKQGLPPEQAKALAAREGAELTKGETTARRAAAKAEQERRKALEADTAYHQEELRLQKSILDGAKKTAANDDLRDQLQKQIINEEADELAAAIKDRAARGGYSPNATENKARAAHLLQLNEQNRLQGAQNVDLAAGSRKLDDQLRALEQSLEGQQALLQIDEQMATTRKQRLDIELKLLDLSEQAARAEQQRILDDKSGKYSDGDRAAARTKLSQIAAQHAGNVAAIQDRNASPLAAFTKQLHEDTDDMNDALQGVAARGLEGLSTGLADVISGTRSLKSAFKDMASSIIADLAKIAIERLIAGVIFPGHALGGQIQGHAGGGQISGPGGPKSDSILSWLSNGEFVVNAASTKRFLPLLQAINDNHAPAFANGGLSVRSPSVSLAGMRSAAPVNYYDLSNSYIDSELWDRVHGIAAQHAAGAEVRATASGARLAQVQMAARAGRRL